MVFRQVESVSTNIRHLSSRVHLNQVRLIFIRNCYPHFASLFIPNSQTALYDQTVINYLRRII